MVSFIEQLEDFGLPPTREEEIPAVISEALPEVSTEKEPEIVDTSLRLQPEELEALKKQAFEEGYQQGREETHAALLPQMIESVDECFSFLEKEEEQRREMLELFSRKVFVTLCDLMGEQISGTDFVQRKFSQDILSFVQESLKECAGEIIVSCNESEEEALKKVLGHYSDVTIKSDPSCEVGCVRILSSRNELKLDRTEWQRKVRDQIKSAMDHIKGSSGHQNRQEEK